MEAQYDAFVSYSTKDSEFVTALRLALEASGRRVWQDVKELELTHEWWAQIKQGIETADNFVMVVSPMSMSSPVCHLEMEHVRYLKKRVIIVLHAAPKKEQTIQHMLERISTQDYLKTITAGRDMLDVAHINWLSVEGEQNVLIAKKEDIAGKLDILTNAFDKDLAYVRQHTRLGERAREWDRNERNASFLLYGDALVSAEKWLQDGKNKKPSPDSLHQTYITISRQIEETQVQQKQARERLIIQFRVASVVLGLIGALAIGATLFATSQVTTANNELIVVTQAQGQAIFGQQTAIAQQNNAQQEAITATVAQGQAQGLARTAQVQATSAYILQSTAQQDARLAQVQVATATAQQGKAEQNAGTAQAQVTSAYALQSTAQNEAIVAQAQVTSAYALQSTAQNEVILAQVQVATATAQQGKAEQNANTAQTQVANAGATLTQIPPTLTQAAIIKDNALIEEDIAFTFASVALSPKTSPLAIINAMNAIVADYPDRATAYQVRGLAYYQQGNFDQAIADFTQAIAIEPDFHEAYSNRGLVYSDMGEFEKALADYDQVLLFLPNDAQTLVNRGLIYKQMGDTEQAIADYALAIQINPQDSVAYFNRAILYDELGQDLLAIADYSTAIELDPLMADAYYNRGTLYASGELDAIAIADYSKAIELNSNYISAYLNRGISYWFVNDLESAIDDFTSVIQKTSDNPDQYPDAYWLRAYVYYLNEDYLEAVSDFEAYMDLGYMLPEAMREYYLESKAKSS